jgi:hypothetical protein
MLAGLSYWKIRKVPPGFCAIVGGASATMTNPAAAMTAIFKRHDNLFTGVSSRRCPRSGDVSIAILELIFVSRQTISHQQHWP